MNKIIPALLSQILHENYHRTWLFGYNTFFKMSPLDMIGQGREEEVIDYLLYQIEGSY